MKILGLTTLILCIYLSQICSSWKISDEKLNEQFESIRGDIHGVSEKFMDDFESLIKKYQNKMNDFVGSIFEGLSKFGKIPKKLSKEGNVKIDEQMLKEYMSTGHHDSPSVVRFKLDNLKLAALVFSKDLPPERYQGIMNVLYVGLDKNATSEEIQSALAYLYGTDDAATKTSFFNKYPDLTADDCVEEMAPLKFPEVENTLKSMTGVKPKVIEDFMAIRDKYPCTYYVLQKLELFVEFLKSSQGSKVDACMVKANKNYANWDNYEPHNTREYMEDDLLRVEFIVQAYLTEDTYGGIINFLKATMPDTPISEIEKALEYVYDDVPKVSQCPHGRFEI